MGEWDIYTEDLHLQDSPNSEGQVYEFLREEGQEMDRGSFYPSY